MIDFLAFLTIRRHLWLYDWWKRNAMKKKCYSPPDQLFWQTRGSSFCRKLWDDTYTKKLVLWEIKERNMVVCTFHLILYGSSLRVSSAYEKIFLCVIVVLKFRLSDSRVLEVFNFGVWNFQFLIKRCIFKAVQKIIKILKYQIRIRLITERLL